MTLTAIVGALVALIPAFHPKGDRVKEAPVDDKTHPRFIAGYDAGLNDGRLERENLNRDLAIQRALVDHWKGQARILAQALRREREQRAYQPQQDPHQALADAQANAQALALYSQMQQSQALQQYAQAQAQHYASMVPSPLGQGQLGQQFGLQQHGGFEGFCNCVPSRAQVWGASHGLVQEVDGLVNRLNQILG